MNRTIDKEYLVSLIRKNIERFDVKTFCPDGGWPDFEKIDISVYSEIEKEDGIEMNLDILFECIIPGGCFPGHKNAQRVYKKILVSEDTLQVIN